MKKKEGLGRERERHIRRANLYRLLADGYRDPQFLAGGEDEALALLLKEVYPSRLSAVRAPRERSPEGGEELEALRVAHAKLFIGPYTLEAPPYGSVYLDGERQVMGDSTLDALNHYFLAGLHLGEENREPADHIGTELEFMYFLIFRQLSSGKKEFMERQKAFLARHLLRWVPTFAGKVREANLHPFYNRLATLTESFLNEEAAALLDGETLQQSLPRTG